MKESDQGEEGDWYTDKLLKRTSTTLHELSIRNPNIMITSSSILRTASNSYKIIVHRPSNHQWWVWSGFQIYNI